MLALGDAKPRPVVLAPYGEVTPRALAEWIVADRRDFLLFDRTGRQNFTKGIPVAPGGSLDEAIAEAAPPPLAKLVLLVEDEAAFEADAGPLRARGLRPFRVKGHAPAWRAELLEPTAPDATVASLSAFLQGRLVPPPPVLAAPAAVIVRPRVASGGGSGC